MVERRGAASFELLGFMEFMAAAIDFITELYRLGAYKGEKTDLGEPYDLGFFMAPVGLVFSTNK